MMRKKNPTIAPVNPPASDEIQPIWVKYLVLSGVGPSMRVPFEVAGPGIYGYRQVLQASQFPGTAG